MNPRLKAQLLAHLDDILERHANARWYTGQGGAKAMAVADAMELEVSTRQAVLRVAGESSTYARQLEKAKSSHASTRIANLLGILRGLRRDVESGYLDSLEEVIHADVFSNHLDVADEFLDKGHIGPSAITAGVALEVHLRHLCAREGIDLTYQVASETKAKPGQRLNDDLAKAGVYDKNDHKQVTAWLGLRNEAAHGNWSAFTSDQVRLLIDGLRAFIGRNPA